MEKLDQDKINKLKELVEHKSTREDYDIGTVECLDAEPQFRVLVMRKEDGKTFTCDFSRTGLNNIPNMLLGMGLAYSSENLTKAIDSIMQNPRNYVKQHKHYQLGISSYTGDHIFKLDRAWNSLGKEVSTYAGDLKFNQKGNLEDYVNGLKDLVVNQPALLTTFVVGASGLVSQALCVSDTNMLLNLYGPTSVGKTTAEHLALAFWGDPRSLTMTWNTTPGYVDDMLRRRGIVPLPVDDMSVVATSPRKQAEQVFALASGWTRGRHNEQALRYFCPIITSSETSLVDHMTNQETRGQLFRMLELEVKRGDLTKNLKHARALEAFMQNNYGIGARKLGQFMVSNKLIDEELSRQHHAILEDLQNDKRLEHIERAANRLSVLVLTCHIINECFDLGINEQNFRYFIIDATQKMFKKADDYIKKYKEFKHIIQENITRFADSLDEYDDTQHLGVLDYNYFGNAMVLIETHRFEALVNGVDINFILEHKRHLKVEKDKKREQPIQQKTIDMVRFWRAHGWVECLDEKQRHVRRRTLGGNQKVNGQTSVYEIIIKDGDEE